MNELMNYDLQLAKINQAGRLLAEASTVEDVKDIRDKASALQHYLQQRDDSGEAARLAAELKLKAERKLGDMLGQTVEMGRPGKVSSGTTLISATIPDGISRDQSSRWQKVASLPEETFQAYLTHAKEAEVMPTTEAVYRLATGRSPGILILQSNSNEWYTPAKYIESARRVLGTIDLDPASCPEANATVRATTYYTIEQDGLAHEWHGTVWLNPPWGGKQAEFVAKLLAEYEAGHVTAAILLVNAHCTDTAWFQPLWDHTLCFTDHRIDYRLPSGSMAASTSTHGSVFVYLGKAHAVFQQEFAQHGAIVRRYLP